MGGQSQVFEAMTLDFHRCHHVVSRHHENAITEATLFGQPDLHTGKRYDNIMAGNHNATSPS